MAGADAEEEICGERVRPRWKSTPHLSYLRGERVPVIHIYIFIYPSLLWFCFVLYSLLQRKVLSVYNIEVDTTMPSTSKLLRGGTVLTHDADDHVHPIKADILIQGNIISKIEKGIIPPEGAEVIDCTDKILSPGFVDTHHHLWQTLLKGRHANHLLLDYMPTGKSISGHLSYMLIDMDRKLYFLPP